MFRLKQSVMLLRQADFWALSAYQEITVAVSWGSQSWLPPAFSRRSVDATTRSKPPGKAAAGKIACPTLFYNRLVLEQLFRDRHLACENDFLFLIRARSLERRIRDVKYRRKRESP